MKLAIMLNLCLFSIAAALVLKIFNGIEIPLLSLFALCMLTWARLKGYRNGLLIDFNLGLWLLFFLGCISLYGIKYLLPSDLDKSGIAFTVSIFLLIPLYLVLVAVNLSFLFSGSKTLQMNH